MDFCSSDTDNQNNRILLILIPARDAVMFLIDPECI